MTQPITEVKVGLDFGEGIQAVGRLAIRDRIIYFEYNDVGEGRNPEVSHLVKLGQGAGLSKKLIADVLDQTKSSLAQWDTLAKKYNVTNANIKLVAKVISRNK